MTKVSLLVVHNIAGVLTPVVDWMVENGHRGKIVAGVDIFSQTSCSPNAIITNSSKELLTTVLSLIREFRPTHIHVNASHVALNFLRLIAPRTPIVFMYHGSEIRTRKQAGLPERPEIKLADKIIVSTQDLSEFGEWYDRPIPKNFYYRGDRKEGTALMMYADFFAEHASDQREVALEVCDKLGVELTIRSNRNKNPIPNSEMPVLYSQYEYFVDFKGLNALSKSALEALACGCKVLHDSNPYNPIVPTDKYSERDQPKDYLRLYLSTTRPSWKTVLSRIPRVFGTVLIESRTGGYLSMPRLGLFGFKRLGLWMLIFLKDVIKRLTNSV